MTDATEAIPADATSLVDAYQIAFDEMTPNSGELLKAIRSTSAEANREAWAAYDLARLKANVWLRQQIADKVLDPLIRDPESGEVLKLPYIGWEDPGFLNSGIHENFVGPDDIFNPGPSTVLHGQRRPVFFNCNRDEFKRLVRKQLGSSSRGGRNPDYDWPDIEAFILKEMTDRGEFREWDVGSNWQRQADLERAVSAYIERTHGGKAAAESSVRAFVSKTLNRWRQSQADN